ncbi:MAG TPA: hypothetical protein VMB85_21855, partial [Bryobacteraceae bacterium]|nr:hypothetical protein [Bryobacteraceae bacterium]
MALMLIVALPLLAALLCWIRPLRNAAWPITLVTAWAVFTLSIFVAIRVIADGRVIGLAGWFEADGLSALMLVIVSLVCALAALFAGGYMRRTEHEEQSRLWWFYCNYNLFAFALLVVPALAEPNLVWVGVELITLFS